MRWRRASIGFAFLALSLWAFANVLSALAQAGSTGGTIGKQDKSISGSSEEDRPREAPHAKPPRPKPAHARASSSQSNQTTTNQKTFNLPLNCNKMSYGVCY